jgi:MEMO1 family protein
MKRSPAVAGMFYPAEPGNLKAMVNEFLEPAKVEHLPSLKAIIVPHAGYIYSGPTAGVAYAQIAKNVPEAHRKTVVLVGPAHFGFTVASVGDYDCLISPLGELKIDSKIVGELENKGLGFDEEVHRPEHSLEVQLPFIRTVFQGSDIVPILCGSVTPDALADVLGPYFARPDWFFCHFIRPVPLFAVRRGCGDGQAKSARYQKSRFPRRRGDRCVRQGGHPHLDAFGQKKWL